MLLALTRTGHRRAVPQRQRQTRYSLGRRTFAQRHRGPGAVTIRDGSHAIFELPNGIVARIGNPHSYETAQRKLRISQWLNRSGVATVRAVPGSHNRRWWMNGPQRGEQL